MAIDPLLIVELLILGVVTGYVAGLLGIGGGGIMVPFLVAILEHRGIDTGLAVKMAIATSMAIIIFTAISSVTAHQRKKAVLWGLFARFAPGIVLGGFIASMGVFAILKGSVLALLFAAFLIFAGTRMFRGKKKVTDGRQRQLPGTVGLFSAGGLIGFLSGLVGIGGGSISVPYMTWRSVPIRNAVGTSAALGLPIALSNVFGYIVAGRGITGLPPYSFGYIWLPALMAVAGCSVLLAPLGARTAHTVPVQRLRRIFAVLLFVLGFYMLYKGLAA